MKKAKKIIEELSESEVKGVLLEIVKALSEGRECDSCPMDDGCSCTKRECKVRALSALLDYAGVIYDKE